MKCSWSSRKSTVQNQRDHLLTVNTWANYLTSLNLSSYIYKIREQITDSGQSSCREITTADLWISWLMQNGQHTVGPRIRLRTKTFFCHNRAQPILNLWVHLLDISILPYICPYWTSTCFWFIEVTLTSIPVFWGVGIYVFLNLYSVDLISKGWKNKRKHRLTRVIRLAVYGKIKCRFGAIIQNTIQQNVLAVTI